MSSRAGSNSPTPGGDPRAITRARQHPSFAEGPALTEQERPGGGGDDSDNGMCWEEALPSPPVDRSRLPGTQNKRRKSKRPNNSVNRSKATPPAAAHCSNERPPSSRCPIHTRDNLPDSHVGPATRHFHFHIPLFVQLFPFYRSC